MGPRRFSATFATALIVIAVSGVATAPRARASSSSDEHTFISLLNGERTSRGLRALSVQSDLTAIARRHADRMAASNAIFHNTSLASQVRGWRVIAENVGRGRRVGAIHDGFMGSSVHRSNILYPGFNQIGVGVAYSDGKIYVSQVFVKRGTVSVSHPSQTVARSVSQSPRARGRTHARPKPIEITPQTGELMMRLVMFEG
jgi:uncharacterized protein YkwD